MNLQIFTRKSISRNTTHRETCATCKHHSRVKRWNAREYR